MTGNLRDFLQRLALAFVLVAGLLLLTNAGAIASHRFPDPDDALRLQQVRDWMAGQGWFDVHQYRIDPADGGVAMHWSRLVDVPIALVIWLARPLLGAQGAEMAALVLVPLATLAAAMALVARVAWERLGRDEAMLACFTLAMSVPVMMQIRPMRIDHHGWQVVAALLAMNGLMTRHARAGGWISGWAMAIGLSISLEGLPFSLVLAGIGAWRWLRWRDGGGPGLWLGHYVAALATGSALCFAATRGMADVAVHCDAISPMHLAVLGWAALVLGAMAIAWTRWQVRGVAPVLAGFALAGAGALALYLGIAPQCRAGAFDMLDPLVRSVWYDAVAEGLPLWRQDAVTMVAILAPGLVALAACAGLVRASAGEERVWWQEYAALQAGALAVAVLVARAGAVSGALAAVPLAHAACRWLRPGKAGVAGRIFAGVVLACALAPAAPVALWGLVPRRAGVSGAVLPVAAAEPAGPVADCHVMAGAQALAALPPGQVLAPLDVGPELLLASRMTVLATGHHRGARAMHDVIAAFMAPPDGARGVIARRKVAYVALCTNLAEVRRYAQLAPGGLAGQLLAGHAPGWLAPVPPAPGSSLRVWRVVAQAGRNTMAAPFMQ
ncbi:MAG TPA: hypothetical protein VN222_17495 [Novosphingobium sp.]|nr:hypothetical protein [Novosphingobium sp.]